MGIQATLVSVLWRFESALPFETEKVRRLLKQPYPQEAAVNVVRRDGTQGAGELLAFKPGKAPSTGTACVYDPSVGDVAVKGIALADTRKMYDKVLVALEKTIPNLQSKLLFSEAWFEGWIHTTKHPLLRFRKDFSEETSERWGRNVLSTEAKPFGMRICNSEPFPPTGPINKLACWRELRVEPMVVNPENCVISLIVRDRDHTKVKKEFREFDEKLKWIQRELGVSANE